MAEPIQLLIVEDEPADAELVARELRKSGFELEWWRVDTAEALRRRLADDPPDLVISDHAMPQFSSEEALDVLQNSGLTIPFIVVSHAIGDEEAVGLIHRGAADFLMKDRLGRLGEAVRQAFERQQLKAAHVAAQTSLVALNAELERRIAERTAELEAANDALKTELEARHLVEEALRQLNEELEQRIRARTADLVVTNERLRALASELTLTEQRERKRLAAELHDHLAQLLALAQIRIGQLRPKLRSDGSEVSFLGGEIHDLLKKAAEYTRTLMAKLSPPVQDETDLPTALTWLGEEMHKNGLTVEVRTTREHVPVPDDHAVLLFQSVRELLMNVVKHAATQRATVTLSIKPDNRLQIEVEDTGRGFSMATVNTKSAAEHFGLFSLRERMEAMGGSFDIKSAPGQGTTARLTLQLVNAVG